MQSPETLKATVRDYWNTQSCGTEDALKQGYAKYSKEYFDCIENARYTSEPEIISFAQFAEARGKKVLEVGVGAGTDFIQWVRVGAQAYGIDLTAEAVTHVERRLELYGLKAKEVRVADAEALPYADNSFDLVYSWGVIHHSPRTKKALDEIVRVGRPGGVCKIMLYNRHSLLAYFFWIRFALLKGRPWKSIAWVLYHYMESTGTKAFTPPEIRAMFLDLPVRNVEITPVLTYYDRLKGYAWPLRLVAWIGSALLGGNRRGWFLLIQCTKG